MRWNPQKGIQCWPLGAKTEIPVHKPLFMPTMSDSNVNLKHPKTTEDAERRRSRQWQRRLLPLMIGFLVLFGLIYVGELVYEVFVMNEFTQDLQDPSANKGIMQLLQDDKALETERKANLMMLANSFHRVHRQTSVAVLSRVIARHSGAFTGMVLSFIGCVFIIGKLNDASGDDLSVEASHVKAHVLSTSPGLVLALIGAALVAFCAAIPPSYPPDQSGYLKQLNSPTQRADQKDVASPTNQPPNR